MNLVNKYLLVEFKTLLVCWQRLILLLHGPSVNFKAIEDKELRNYIASRSFIETNDDKFWIKLRLER